MLTMLTMFTILTMFAMFTMLTPSENTGLNDCYTALDGTYASTCVFKSKVPLKEVKWTRYSTDIKGVRLNPGILHFSVVQNN